MLSKDLDVILTRKLQKSYQNQVQKDIWRLRPSFGFLKTISFNNNVSFVVKNFLSFLYCILWICILLFSDFNYVLSWVLVSWKYKVEWINKTPVFSCSHPLQSIKQGLGNIFILISLKEQFKKYTKFSKFEMFEYSKYSLMGP